MQCDFCGKDANIEIKMGLNGEMRTMHLCSDCYHEKMQDMIANIPQEWGGEELGRQVREILDNAPDFNPIKDEENTSGDKAYEYQRKSLKKQRNEYIRMLEAALEAEDYEHCAIYRDEINRIGDALVRLNEERKNLNGV